MERTFDTPDPITLYAEIGAGSIEVNAEQTTHARVVVTGDDADQVDIRQDGRQVSVIAPRRMGFLSKRDGRLSVTITIPTTSHVATRTGSADVTIAGRITDLRVKAGSGRVRVEDVGGAAAIDTGSGDVEVDDVAGALRCKCGSGQVRIGRADAESVISTGSGDVTIERTAGPAMTKSGSGSLRVLDAGADLVATTASGDIGVDLFRAGGLTAKSASGDVRVGVPSGIPIWTDVSAVTGRVTSTLEGAGEPKPGDDYLELRISSVSGDIVLDQR